MATHGGPRLGLTLLLLILPGCSLIQELFSLIGPTPAPVSRMRESVVGRAAPMIRQALDPATSEAHAQIVSAHTTVETLPARFKRRLAMQSLKQPWEGLTNLEGHGLLVAELTEGGGRDLPAILDLLEAGMDRTSGFQKPVPYPATADPQALLAFMVDTLEQASIHRDKALAALSDTERRFLFAHGRTLAEQFTPQVSQSSEQTTVQIHFNLRFAELLEERVDYASLLADAQGLARLANERWLRHLPGAFQKALPANQVPPGITGDVMLAHRTPDGLIVIGGPGPNTYELDQRFALIIDLGGDDLYRGLIGASGDEQHGNAMVIDMAGNDTYEGAPLGLATGRLGVGLVIDHAGDDVYQLHAGSGGAGFAGLGILLDARGNDAYMGDRLTQGAAIGGLGLLFDLAGNDRYTSHGFALGFGGPLGLGAVIDAAGDDHYQCGSFFPSAYNAHDAPQAKPDDPLFQYDCFGLGTGSGFRVLTKRPELQAQSLAGGWGLLVDIEGNDRYQSANFSQGTGYYFGTGLLCDLDGDDDYGAARYGQGASAHHGVALFIDRHGDDRYRSTGPFYNAGVAWDHGISMAIDAGSGHDTYALQQSTGLGKADHTGWAVFIDEGGRDQYAAKSGLGEASEQSLAAFFDLAGKDTYTISTALPEFRPADGVATPRKPGGLFVDR
jgi:hypothetical protein